MNQLLNSNILKVGDNPVAFCLYNAIVLLYEYTTLKTLASLNGRNFEYILNFILASQLQLGHVYKFLRLDSFPNW